MKKYNKKKHVLGLKTLNADMTAYGGFQYPISGIVECPDWQPTKQCGNGLHFALNGQGDGSLFSWNTEAIWVLLFARANEIIELDGKVKAPRIHILATGTRDEIIELAKIYGLIEGIIGGTSTSGDGGTSTSGYRGTSTSGDGGTSTSGDRGTSTSGDGGTSTSGDGGTSTSGYGGTIIIKYWNGKRYRFKIGYVGEDGIEPNIAYKLDNNFEFVRA